jgi:regulator of RNase E activity RraB
MQMKLAPITLSHLRRFGASDDKELKLEFFFYANDRDKAEALAKDLRTREYEAETVKSAGNNNLLLVTGWTTKMKTDEETIERWTEDMCELGYRNDCEFDGWGTTPDQD